LQQLLAVVPLQDLAQPDDLASLEQAAVFEALPEQQAFAGVDLPVLTFSVLALSAVVTFCADTVFTVKAKIKANNEITRASFFIGMDD
jgi:hypothetical protein